MSVKLLVIVIIVFKRYPSTYCLKTFSGFFYFLYLFFIFTNIGGNLIYWRKFNAGINKLIKTVGHLARFFENDVEHTHLCQQF